MYITCYYDIYHNHEKKEKYLSYFKELAETGVPIVLFTDASLLSFFKCLPYTVKVILLDVTTCKLYQIAMAYTRELPLERDPEKDTKEFFCLMNTKVEFIKNAAELFPEVDTFMWIDFGVMKLINNKEIFLEKVKEISGTSYTKIMIPGCWDQAYLFKCDATYWRFCGTFLIIPRVWLERFYEDSKHILTTFCTESCYKLTWETNLWYITEYHYEKDIIQWYHAIHDESLLLNLPKESSNL